MKRVGLALIALVALSLGGCVSAQERAAQIAAVDDETCRGYGVARGSELYVRCRMTREQTRAMDDYTAAQAGAQMRAAGAALIIASQPR